MPPRAIGAVLVFVGIVVLLLTASTWPPTAGDHGGPGRPVPKMTPYPDPSVGGPSTLRP